MDSALLQNSMVELLSRNGYAVACVQTRNLMKFSLFKPPVVKHLRKSREYLEDAKVKRVEHQAAAERHSALTQLYAERISRIEAEIKEVVQARSDSNQPAPAADNERVCPTSDPVVIHPSQVSYA